MGLCCVPRARTSAVKVPPSASSFPKIARPIAFRSALAAWSERSSGAPGVNPNVPLAEADKLAADRLAATMRPRPPAAVAERSKRSIAIPETFPSCSSAFAVSDGAESGPCARISPSTVPRTGAKIPAAGNQVASCMPLARAVAAIVVPETSPNVRAGSCASAVRSKLPAPPRTFAVAVTVRPCVVQFAAALPSGRRWMLASATARVPVVLMPAAPDRRSSARLPLPPSVSPSSK